MKKITKSILIVIGIIFLLLIATNPTNNNFRDYLSSIAYKLATDSNSYRYRYGRHKNYLIYSVYYYDFHSETLAYGFTSVKRNYGVRYIGILKNFYQVKPVVERISY